jgi:hypothetical protein
MTGASLPSGTTASPSTSPLPGDLDSTSAVAAKRADLLRYAHECHDAADLASDTATSDASRLEAACALMAALDLTDGQGA